jgi:sporulation integral membrane protein YlbJ
MISGYPVGAKLTSNLRENNLITKIEGDRLISFSSTSGPLFLLGTVLTGMLNAPELSPLILIPHYLGAITIGLIFRIYKKNDKSSIEHDIYSPQNTNNSIGSLISGCIKDGIDSLLMIGGFVIIYSVIINIMFKSNLFNSILNVVSKVTFVDIEILKDIVAGIIELTNGCKMISSLNIKLINKILILNFLIGWGGFSIHSQALSFISNTDINSKIYLVSKFFHGVLASFYTYMMYIFKYKEMLSTTFSTSNFIIPTDFEHWLSVLVNSAKITVTSFIFISILSMLIKQLKVKN